MTSANLSLADRVRNHRKYITRTLWISIIAFLFMAVYYVLGVIMMVSRAINYGNIYHQPESTIRIEKLNAVTKIMGFEQIGFIIIIFTAVAFAFQGFSYVFDQRKIDFFLSQPTTRAERMRKNYFNAFSTFIVMYLGVEAIALLAATVMGAMNSVVLVSVLLETLRSIVLFFTIYNFTVLAILLSGSLPIATMVLFFLFGITCILGFEINAYKDSFFATYSTYGSYDQIVASPIYDRVVMYDKLTELARYDDHNVFMDSIKKILALIWTRELDILLSGIIANVLVVILSRFRRAEHAGKTVVFRSFRWLMKIASCVVVGLAAGFFVQVIYLNVWSSKIYVLMFVVMVLATFVFGCILEAILEGNIRKLICGKAQTVLAVCIVAMVFVVFRGDLLGYDSYIPKWDDIESCAILQDDYSFELYRDYGNVFDDYAEEYMHLTDISGCISLARIGMEARKEEYKLEKEGKYNYRGDDTTILYRLKNGKKVYRNITIPYDTDEILLASIIDSDEYKTGYFKIFHDEQMRYADKTKEESTIRYTTITDDKTAYNLDYEELSDAYRKDVLEHYTYEMAENTTPIGRIEYNSSGFSDYACCDLNVFPDYTNTIGFLKKYGIYSDSKIDVEYIDSVEVTNYYSGYVAEDGDEYTTPDDGYEYPTVSMTYIDKDEIAAILECAHTTDYYSRWFNSYKHDNNLYNITVTDNNGRTSYLLFETGKVPDFVKADTE